MAPAYFSISCCTGLEGGGPLGGLSCWSVRGRFVGGVSKVSSIEVELAGMTSVGGAWSLWTAEVSIDVYKWCVRVNGV